MLDDSLKLKFKNMQLICTEENENVDLHNHTEFEILLFTDGSAEVTVNDDTYQVKKDDMIFVNPLEIHSVKVNDKAYSLKCICFDASQIPDKRMNKKVNGDDMQIRNYIDCDNFDISYIKELFLKIFDVYNAAEECFDSEIWSYIVLIFIHLFRNNCVLSKESNSKASDFCIKVLAYIAENYSENITSCDISAKLSYSHGYFCRKFRTEFGKNFSEYLTIYRISMAKISFEEKKCTVAEVAYNCGFNSVDHFSRCFKRLIGILPSEYKKKYENQRKTRNTLEKQR